jgi:phosphotransferase system enzyme I (PtsI)
MNSKIVEGLAISAGLGIAPVFLVRNIPFETTGRTVAPEDIDAELMRLEPACTRTGADLLVLEGDQEPGSMSWMLANPLFHGSIVDRIRAGQCAEDAVVQTTHDLVVIFSESPDPLYRARGDDVEEIGRRLLRHLHGLPSPVLRPEHPIVIVTDEMTAFDAARLRADLVAGIITERGGATSHFAIIVKQLGIPAISGVRNVFEWFCNGEMCICDGTNGKAVVAPDEAELREARSHVAFDERARSWLLRLASRETVTKDGVPIRLWGNIAGPADVQPILDAGASGIGMFRTEFIFMGDEAPSEERQAHIYADILRRTPGPVVMRTVEAGGDKTIPYLAGEPEENPNLGWQGVRMCLDMEDLFLSQLRAMLRASSEGELWIMFPFVSALWELRRCRELVDKAHTQLEDEAVGLGNYKVGIMIEVPSAALLADAFLRDFDFCSIGTNDLTQFTLAADRMNPKVARWYDPFHPGVLRLIAMSARAAGKARKPIGMAGDMASNPLSIPFLIGLGLEILSATAPRIPAVKETILSLNSRWAHELAREVLQLQDTDEVREYLQRKQDELG